MKLVTPDGPVYELPVLGALCALPVKEIRLDQQDINRLIEIAEHKPEALVDVLRTWYIRFPPEIAQ